MRKRFTLSGTCLHSWSVQEPPLVPKQRSRNMCKGLWQNFWAAMLFKVAASQYPWTDGSRGERSTSNQKSLWWFRTGSSKVVWDWRWAAWKFDQWQKRKERKKRKEESKKEGRKEGRKERKRERKKERRKERKEQGPTILLLPRTVCGQLRQRLFVIASGFLIERSS